MDNVEGRGQENGGSAKLLFMEAVAICANLKGGLVKYHTIWVNKRKKPDNQSTLKITAISFLC